MCFATSPFQSFSFYGTSLVTNMDEIVRNALKHYKKLPASDKTEIGLLKSRIDEQSNLIMILKTRADDEYKRRKVFEDLVDGLQHTINDYEEQVEAVKLKFRLLEEKFDVLGTYSFAFIFYIRIDGFVNMVFFYSASNHHEMIQIKNEYKQQNEKFRMKYESILKKIGIFKEIGLQKKLKLLKH